MLSKIVIALLMVVAARGEGFHVLPSEPDHDIVVISSHVNRIFMAELTRDGETCYREDGWEAFDIWHTFDAWQRVDFQPACPDSIVIVWADYPVYSVSSLQRKKGMNVRR